MKIGILTFHCAHNYGAVLQAYAMQEFLKTEGHDVQIINYRPKYLTRAHSVFEYRFYKSRSVAGKIKYILKFPFIFIGRSLRHYQFNQFITSSLHLTPEVYSETGKIDAGFDVYLFGSDQIWNMNITDGIDPVFFGQFAAKAGARKIAYAASMEEVPSFMDGERKALFADYMKSFYSISVREDTVRAFLQPLTKMKVHTVLDPALLVNPDIWDQLAEMPNVNNKYVLVYQVRCSKYAVSLAHNLAKQIGGIVIQLSAAVYPGYVKNRHQYASVEQFVGWFKYAAYIVTTSFHGTAFSVIFNKPFYTIQFGDSTDNRSKNLLQSLKLENKMVPENATVSLSAINYLNANDLLDTYRFHSAEFLHQSFAS